MLNFNISNPYLIKFPYLLNTLIYTFTWGCVSVFDKYLHLLGVSVPKKNTKHSNIMSLSVKNLVMLNLQTIYMVIDNYTHNTGIYMVLGHSEPAPTTHHPLDVCYY